MNNELLEAAKKSISRHLCAKNHPVHQPGPIDAAWELIEAGDVLDGLRAAREHFAYYHMDKVVAKIDAALATHEVSDLFPAHRAVQEYDEYRTVWTGGAVIVAIAGGGYQAIPGHYLQQADYKGSKETVSVDVVRALISR